MADTIVLSSTAREEIGEFKPDVFEQISFQDFTDRFLGKVEGVDSRVNPFLFTRRSLIWSVRLSFVRQGEGAENSQRTNHKEDLFKGEDGKVYVLISKEILGLSASNTKFAQVWLE